MSRKWTPEELQTIHNSNGKVPFIEGRTTSAVREKMSALGLLKLNSNSLWTSEEIKLLMEGKHIEGRTQYAIKHALRRLKSSKNIASNTKTATKTLSWNQENVNILKDLFEHGYDAEEIFSMNIFGFKQKEIQNKINKLGLKEIEVTNLPGENKDLFKRFLEDNWKFKTPRDLMEIWNKENASNIVNLKTVVYYLAILNIQIPYIEIQRIYELREKEHQLNISNKGSTSQLSENIRLERVKAMRERAEKHRDIWTGLPNPKGYESLTTKDGDVWAESI